MRGTEVSVLAGRAVGGLTTLAGGGSGQPASSGVLMSKARGGVNSGPSLEVDTLDTSVGPFWTGPAGSTGGAVGGSVGTVTRSILDTVGGA